MPYLDDATMQAIESDLAAAHQSLAHGDLDMKGATKTGIKILETVVPAAAFSYMNARAAGGELKVGPVPVDLAVGLGLTLLSLFDVAGGYEDDLLNIGIGALASYGARTGAAFGAASAAGATATATAGHPGVMGYPAAHQAGQGAHGPHNAPMLSARMRGYNEHMTHHVQGMGYPYHEISGAAHGPVPPGTQRFVVTQVG